MANSEFPSIELSRLLYSSSRLLIQRIQLTLNEFGLTYPQFLVLSILWEEDGLKVHQLGEKLNLDSGTLTPLLKKLESQNILKRKRGEEDERTVSIHLTYPGKSLQSKTLSALALLDEQIQLQQPGEVQILLPILEELLNKLKTLKT
ncbi:DNA-binding transcriptional regulator, MarR family [Algoriphagus alkaliphilus]|uniref:DNA-binding transcriptional regulator, MarR family n=1 Tax=Algoriphagus alkaliphilus TaxID=279824 RepID=A0A1G5YXQ7_9BACT|nr:MULTISPECIES: MarR family transcriptional regulator [Algoriphagus]MDP2041898.1 MarR family transcriptional regulator [Algoriphagus sp.]MDP3474009.1 MarR family transcriptional regulator [Algoriphagus sp.]SDA87559.1 DNA-binding transcriptional regulator, MarR family [Algoriphagus alkaliphilus]